MSITITATFICDHCQQVDSLDFDPSSNLIPMFDAAFVAAGSEFPWEYAINRTDRAGHLAPLLERVVSDMRARPDFYRGLNPANGWGSYDVEGGTIVDVIWQPLLDFCRRRPSGIVRVSS